MGRITTDQSHQIMAALATNTDWTSIDFAEADLQNRIIRNASEAGTLFTEWLKSTSAVLPPAEKPRVLRLHETLSVGSPEESFDADAFFMTRPGLWVSDDFKRLVLPKAKIAVPVVTSIQSFDLEENANDGKIKEEMPGNHEVALWHIAKFIEAQEGGKSGPLLNNGYWNIFYFAGLVVYVRWRAGDRWWYVSAWPLGGLGWFAGLRAFSSN